MSNQAPRLPDEPVAKGSFERDAPAQTLHGLRFKGWMSGFVSLRQRNFRLFWTGQLISVMGSWMQSIGQAWLALELSHSAFQLGLIGALQMAPVLLFSLFAGVLADRWPKRRILLVTQSVAMAQSALLWILVVTNAVQLWHLYVLAFLLGLSTCLDLPTRRAFVIEMVGRADLPNAVALNASLTNMARIVGPALGGVIIGASDVSSLFLLNALSFLAVLVGLAMINTRELHAQTLQRANGDERGDVWLRVREGLRYVVQTPAVALMIVVVGLALLFGSNFNVVLPLFATQVLHVGARGFGFLSAMLGLGSLLAALWLAWSNQQPTILRVLIGAAAFGVLEVGFAFSRVYPLSLALIAAVGFAESAFVALSMMATQLLTPDHLQGRVISVSVLFLDGSVPLGYLLIGGLASLHGAPVAVLIGALLSMAVTGAGWLTYRYSRLRWSSVL